MTNGTATEDTSLQEARIVQASVMDETSVLLTFSNDSSALVSCEDLKQLVLTSGAKVTHGSEISE